MEQKDFYLHKRGAVWYVRCRLPDGRIGSQKSTGQTNRTAAEKWARARLPLLLCPDQTLHDWAGRFFLPDCPHVSRLTDEGRSYNPVVKRNNRQYVEAHILTDPLAGKDLALISRADILAFRSRVIAKVGKCRTAQLVMSALRIILREALFRDFIPKDPFLGVGLISYEPKTRKALAPDIMAKVLNPAAYQNPVFWRATMCAAFTGMRAGEVRGLTWADIGPAKIMVVRTIPPNGGPATPPKWGKIRSCPYPAGLAEILEPFRQEPGAWVFTIKGGPLGYKRWADAVRAAGGPGVCLHALRHTLNTRLREAGIPDELLRGSFGWSAPDIQENYTHRELYDYSGQSAAIDTILGGSHGSN